MDTLSFIADILSILGFLLTVFVANRVFKIEQSFKQSGDNNKSMSQTAKGNNNKQFGQQ